MSFCSLSPGPGPRASSMCKAGVYTARRQRPCMQTFTFIHAVMEPACTACVMACSSEVGQELLDNRGVLGIGLLPYGLACPPEHCPACSAQTLQTLHACSWLVRSGGGTRPADSMSVLLLHCDGGTQGELTTCQLLGPYSCDAGARARAVHAADIHAQRFHQQAGRGRLQRRPRRNDAAQQGRTCTPAESGWGALTMSADCCFTACVLLRDMFRSCDLVLLCRAGDMVALVERLRIGQNQANLIHWPSFAGSGFRTEGSLSSMDLLSTTQ